MTGTQRPDAMLECLYPSMLQVREATDPDEPWYVVGSHEARPSH